MTRKNFNILEMKNNLVPTKIDMFLYATLAVIIILIGNAQILTKSLVGDSYASYNDVRGLLDTQLDRRLTAIDNLRWAPDLAVFAVWALVGVVVYSIGVAVYNQYVELKEDVDISFKYIHPRNFVSSKFWKHVAIVSFIRFTLIIGMVTIGFLIFGVLMPSSGEIIKSILAQPTSFAILALFLSFTIITISVMAEAIFLKLAINSRHYA